MDKVQAPQLVFVCTNGACDEAEKERTADAGIIVGDGVMLTGTHACMTCGSSLLPSQPAVGRAPKESSTDA